MKEKVGQKNEVNRAVKHQAIKQKEQTSKKGEERREYSSEQEMPSICCYGRTKKKMSWN